MRAADTAAVDGTALVQWTLESPELFDMALDYDWCAHPHGQTGRTSFVYLSAMKPFKPKRGGIPVYKLWVKTLCFTDMIRVAVLTGHVPFARWTLNLPLSFVPGSFNKGELYNIDYRNVIATVNAERAENTERRAGLRFGCNRVLPIRGS